LTFPHHNGLTIILSKKPAETPGFHDPANLHPERNFEAFIAERTVPDLGVRSWTKKPATRFPDYRSLRYPSVPGADWINLIDRNEGGLAHRLDTTM
jgi:hypothetical protein